MMQKGYKRKAKGMALLRCIVGLIVLVIIALLLYFVLTMDYSDRLAEGTQLRSYVAVQPTAVPTAVPVVAPVAEDTPEPEAETEVPTDAPDVQNPDQTVSADGADVIAMPDTADATPVVTVTEAPVTPAPTDEPEPTETPEPTKVPTGLYAPMQQIKTKMPSPTTKDVKLGITECVRSTADQSGVLYLAGYAYIDRSDVDAAATEYRLVIVSSNGAAMMADVNRVEGISGLTHENAKCQNAAGADFEVYLNVANFPDDVYYLGIVFNNKGSYVLAQFPNNLSFSTVNHRVLNDVPTVSSD